MVQQVGWKPSDLDLIEANEAFAAQALAVNKVALAGERRFEGVHFRKQTLGAENEWPDCPKRVDHLVDIFWVFFGRTFMPDHQFCHT